MANEDIQLLLNETIESKNQFDGFLSSSTTAISQFIEKARADLSEIDRLKIDAAAAKGGIDATLKATSADQGIVGQSKADVESFRSAAAALSEKLTNEHNEVASKISELQAQQATLQNILQTMIEQRAAAEANGVTLVNLVNEFTQVKDRFANLNSETGTQYDSLVKKQEGLQGKIDEIEEDRSKISDLRKKLLESSDEAVSVQDEIERLRTQITEVLEGVSSHRKSAATELAALTEQSKKTGEDFQAKQVHTFAELHNALKAQILSLLPSAGAAGIAYTFYDAKSRYAPTSYSRKPGAEKASGVWAWVRARLGYNPASLLSVIFFYGMFLIPLAFIAIGSLQLLFHMENDPHFVLSYQMLLVRFLIVLPLGTISGFGFASLQLYRKLFEEYNHKQRVMELYESFNSEIEKIGDGDQKRALLNIMLNTVSDKAWQVNQEKAKQEGAEDAMTVLEKFSGAIAKIKAAAS